MCFILQIVQLLLSKQSVTKSTLKAKTSGPLVS